MSSDLTSDELGMFWTRYEKCLLAVLDKAKPTPISDTQRHALLGAAQAHAQAIEAYLSDQGLSLQDALVETHLPFREA